MSVAQITGKDDRLFGYQDFSIQCFDSIQEFIEYAELAKSKGTNELNDFLNRERNSIDEILQRSRQNVYGLKGTDKAPLSYQDAINRNTFVYKDEYHKAKEKAKRLLDKALEKTSLAEAMKSKMIFTERELGEFVYERASMSIKPNLYYYSEVHKTEIDEKFVSFKIVDGKENYTYIKDETPVLLCIKVTIPPNSEYNETNEAIYEYKESGSITDEELESFTKKGILSISSNVKKVYQFKEKQPRIKNAVKIFMGTSVGGYSQAGEYGDFYTGVTAVLLAEYLEARDYSVEIVMVLGGGRCRSCLPTKLNTPSQYGRRFVGVTVKKFDEQLDLDAMLYWTSDPSALKIRLMRYFNVFHWLYGDDMTYSSTYWHSINTSDLAHPIGTYYKSKDIKKGNKDLMYFLIHQVENEVGVAQAVLNIIMTCENTNYHINQKAINQVQ
jgi:hypothetical protein